MFHVGQVFQEANRRQIGPVEEPMVNLQFPVQTCEKAKNTGHIKRHQEASFLLFTATKPISDIKYQVIKRPLFLHQNSGPRHKKRLRHQFCCACRLGAATGVLRCRETGQQGDGTGAGDFDRQLVSVRSGYIMMMKGFMTSNDL